MLVTNNITGAATCASCEVRFDYCNSSSTNKELTLGFNA